MAILTTKITLDRLPSLSPESRRNMGVFKGRDAAEQNENHRIISDIDLNEWTATILATLMEAVKKHPDVSKKVDMSDIEIHVADGGGYAYTFQEYNGKGHIIIDAHLLQLCKTVDEVAFTIGHELGHRIYRQENSLSSYTKVSVAEEMFCDKIGLELAAIAGYSADGGPNLFSRLIEEKGQKEPKYLEWMKRWADRIGSVFDEHLSLETRYSNVRLDFPGIDRLLRAGMFQTLNNRATPIPRFVTQAAAASVHIPLLRQRREESQYESLPAAEKIAVLTKFLGEVGTVKVRRNDFISALHAITPQELPTGGREKEKCAAALEKLLIILQDASHDYEHPLKVAAPKIIHSVYGHIAALTLALEGKQYSDFEQQLLRDKPPLGRLAQGEERLLVAIRTGTDADVIRAASQLAFWEGQFLCDGGAVLFDRLDKERGRFLELAKNDESAATATVYFKIFHNYDERYQGMDEMPLSLVEKLKWDRLSTAQQQSHNRYLAHRRQKERRDIPLSEFLKDPELFFEQHRHLMRIPPEVADDLPKAHPFHGLSPAERWSKHVDFMNELTGEWSRILKSGVEEDCAKLRRALFYSGQPWPGSPLRQSSKVSVLSTAEESSYSWQILTDPILTFTEKSKDTLTLGERLYLIGCVPHKVLDVNTVFSRLAVSKPASFESIRRFCDEVRTDEKLGVFTGGIHELPSQILSSAIDQAAGVFTHPNDIYSMVDAARALKEYSHDLFDDTLRAELEGLRVKEAPLALAIEEPSRLTLEPGRFLDTVEFMREAGLFPNSACRKNWCDEALQRVSDCIDPDVQYALSLRLLALTKVMRDVDFKNDAIKLWTKAATAITGQDNGTQEFQEEILGKLNEAKELVGGDMRVELAAELAEAVVSQAKLAYAIRDSVTLKAEDLPRYNIAVKATEELFKAVERDPANSKEILDFLTAPLTEESVERFIKFTEKLRYDEGGKLFDSLLDRYLSHDLKQREIRLLSEDLYKHFWDLDTPLRVIAVKQLLIPPKRYYGAPQETFAAAAETVIGKIFPKKEFASAAEARDAKWGEEFVRTFLSVSHESEWGFILGALAAASRQDENIAQVSTGRKLKAILECLGPAYIKLGQALHSYPGTPEEIKRDLASLKGQAAPPKRWELFSLIEKVVPDEHRARIAWYGPRGGSASFNMTIEYTDSNQTQNLFSILREHSLARALKGFDTLTDVTKELCKSHRDLKSFRSDALRILDNARSMTLLETDMNVGYTQFKTAREQYHRLEIGIEGDTFKFKAPNWNWYGKEYRSMEYAPGLHFDELPESTPREEALKAKIATAIFVAEIQQILAGKKFDCDRHERQYKIEARPDGTFMIYAFDHGGMSEEEPGLPEKLKLTQLLTSIFGEIENGEGIQNIVYRGLNSHAQNSEYFTRIQKSLLSLSFAFRHLSASAIKGLFELILNGNDIDSVIRTGLIKEFAKTDRRAYLLLYRPLARHIMSKDSGISISRKN